MSKSLSSSLSQFISNSDKSDFSDPYLDFTDKEEKKRSDIKSLMEHSDELKASKKERDKKDKFSKIIDEGNQLIDQLTDDDIADDFDGYLDDYFMDDEDVDLKRNLVQYGRKYARDTKVSGETSEINKAYTKNEKLLSDLLKEIEEDKELVQKDITNMRMMRTRNYKTLADLIESKSQFHNTALSVIKEMNNMTKSQFDLQLKADKAKKEDDSDDSTANRAIQQLFSVGRSNILGGGEYGGYSSISGSEEAGSFNDENYGYDEDEIIQKKYFSNDNYEDEVESDGDKFLKYEGRGVHYILLYNDEGYKEIIAEDKDGNIIPDYPLPSDPNNLEFDVSESTGTAVDNLSNQYQLRKI